MNRFRFLPGWLQRLLKGADVPSVLDLRSVAAVLDAFQGGWAFNVKPSSSTATVAGAVGANTATGIAGPSLAEWPEGFWYVLLAGTFNRTAGAGTLNIGLELLHTAAATTAWGFLGTTGMAAGPSFAGLANLASGALPQLLLPRANEADSVVNLRNVDAIAAGDSVVVRLSGFAVPPGFKPL